MTGAASQVLPRVQRVLLVYNAYQHRGGGDMVVEAKDPGHTLSTFHGSGRAENGVRFEWHLLRLFGVAIKADVITSDGSRLS